MTKDKILELVNAMTPPELTAKVAEFKGWTRRTGPPPGWYSRLNGVWVLQRHSDYSPPTRIEDAWPPWEELETNCTEEPLRLCILAVRDRQNKWSLNISLKWFDFGRLGPLAITRAYVWWIWCQKEGA